MADITAAQGAAAGEEIAERMTRRAILGARYDAGLARDVIAILDKLERDLVGQIAAIDITGPARPSARRARLETLLNDTRKAIRANYRRVRLLTENELDQLFEIEADATRAAMRGSFNSVGVRIGVSLPGETYLAALAEETLVLGQPLSGYWARQEAGLIGAFRAEMEKGLTAGETVNDLIRRIRGGTRQGQIVPGIMAASRTQAAALVRTSAASVGNGARFATFEANLDVIEKYQHLSRLDGRTTQICILRAGKLWDAATKAPIGHSLPFQPPPIHINCLPGDSLVTPGGAITGASKRWVDAELIDIRTASGRELSATPNHPILTDRGWVAAQFVNEADRVICIARAEAALGGVGYDENVKASIHDLAEAAFVSSAMIAMPVPVTAPDFHGDGVDSEVATVATNGRLLSEGLTGGAQPSSEPMLASADKCLGAAASDLPLDFGVGPDAATRCGVGRLEHAVAGDSIGAAPTLNHLSADGLALIDAAPANTGGVLAASEHASRAQHAVNGTWADAEIFRDLTRAGSGEVEFDQVVSVGRRPFSGHVYNLETATGWYSAGGIVTHNCRSVLVVVVVGAEPPTDQNGETWFKSLSNADQNELFGRGRADLYRRGDITMSALLDQSGRPIPLSDLRLDQRNAGDRTVRRP